MSNFLEMISQDYLAWLNLITCIIGASACGYALCKWIDLDNEMWKGFKRRVICLRVSVGFVCVMLTLSIGNSIDKLMGLLDWFPDFNVISTLRGLAYSLAIASAVWVMSAILDRYKFVEKDES
jgi:hypothetical protein